MLAPEVVEPVLPPWAEPVLPPLDEDFPPVGDASFVDCVSPSSTPPSPEPTDLLSEQATRTIKQTAYENP
jgi:hypothetical protein